MPKDNKKPLEHKSVSRRKAVKQIVGGVSALAAYNMLPVKWEKPIIEQIFLPAHAAVSGITLSDPCTTELVSGDQSSSIDVIRVAGFVTPPVGGLEVTIAATPNGGSGGPVTVTTSTGSDGTYSAEITMVGGPGIIGVGATTTIAGVSGAAHCPVGIPPADHPSANRPQQSQSYRGTITLSNPSNPTESGDETFCVTITGDNVVAYNEGNSTPGTGTVSGGASIDLGFNNEIYRLTFNQVTSTFVDISVERVGNSGTITASGPGNLPFISTPCPSW